MWTTVESAGRKAATFFWVGSEVEGTRASSWLPYDSVPFECNASIVCKAGCHVPSKASQHLSRCIFQSPDGQGHTFGPDSAEMAIKVHEMDAWVGEIVKIIDSFRTTRRIALIVVSDHGMAEQTGQGIYLGDYISESDVIRRVIGPYLDLTVSPGQRGRGA